MHPVLLKSVPLWLFTALLAVQALAAGVPPQELVRETSSRMLTAMHDHHDVIEHDPAHLYQLVEDIVLPYFDFRRMSQWVLGKNWRSATPEQREQFVEQFRVLLVRTYATALNEYADEEIHYLPFAEAGHTETVTVRTEIEQPGVGVIPINYSMYESGNDGWKVYDISISGVSLVTNYRSSYGTIIRRDGIDRLIEQLAEHNRQRADG